MTVAIVGAAETTQLGKVPDMSQLQLHADAALNALADSGLKPSDLDGVATAGASPMDLVQYLGIEPRWVDGTSVGGCSFMLHVRHAVAAIESGQASTILITHGESGRSGVGRGGFGAKISGLDSCEYRYFAYSCIFKSAGDWPFCRKPSPLDCSR